MAAALYHEAKRHRVPITRLLGRLLRECLQNTPGRYRTRRDWPEVAATLGRQKDDQAQPLAGSASRSPISLR